MDTKLLMPIAIKIPVLQILPDAKGHFRHGTLVKIAEGGYLNSQFVGDFLPLSPFQSPQGNVAEIGLGTVLYVFVGKDAIGIYIQAFFHHLG